MRPLELGVIVIVICLVAVILFAIIALPAQKTNTGKAVGVDVNISEDVQEALDNLDEIVDGAEEAINDATDAAVDAAGEIVNEDTQETICDIIAGQNQSEEVMTQ